MRVNEFGIKQILGNRHNHDLPSVGAGLLPTLDISVVFGHYRYLSYKIAGQSGSKEKDALAGK